MIKWQLGMAIRRVCLKDEAFVSSPYDGKNFLIPSLSLGASQSLVLLRKTLFLVNLSTIITIIFNKTCFFNKNKIEIINKFIP